MKRDHSPRKPPHAAAQAPVPRRPHDLWICAFLAIATLAVYSQLQHYDFVGYDDPAYVIENPHVRAGLSSEGLVWAFTTGFDGNWFPLTWLTHMLDCQFFGVRAGPQHLTNVFLHMLTTLILFACLKRMTGSRWRSALVAFLFALHPLHVESVAWITERKDVLSALFWFLTIWAYLRYVDRPKTGRYLLVLAAFCCGLMSKPMNVTLPFVLLLLDVWPLQRIRIPGSDDHNKSKERARTSDPVRLTIAAVLREKAPLFALAAGSSAVTYMVQKRAGAVVSWNWIPPGTRFGNALISYIAYIAQTFWPAKLAVFYPHPINLPEWQVIAGAGAVLGISILSLCAIRRFPYLAVGWFWYLGALVPVIGLVQVGMQARADRYTYVPLVGIFIVLVWGVADVARRLPRAKYALAGVSTLVCSACLVLTWFQIQHWRDSASLFRHAIESVPGNYVGYFGMGGVLRDQGRLDDAVASYREALRLFPRYASAHGSLADVYLRQDRVDEAMAELSEALRLDPNASEDHVNLATALFRKGNSDEAIIQLKEAIRLDPDSADAHYNLGRTYGAVGRLQEAAAQFSEAIRLRPDSADAHYNLGVAFASLGRMKEAVGEFEEAVRLKPDYAAAHNNLGSALASQGQYDQAISHFVEALRIDPDFAEARENLDYALSLRKK